MPGDPAVLPAVGAALAAVRKVKSEAKVGMRAGITSMTLALPEALTAAVQVAEADLRAAGRIETLRTYAAADALELRDALSPPRPA